MKKKQQDRIIKLEEENNRLKSKLHVMEIEAEFRENFYKKCWDESMLLIKYKKLVEQYEKIINKQLNEWKRGEEDWQEDHSNQQGTG